MQHPLDSDVSPIEGPPGPLSSSPALPHSIFASCLNLHCAPALPTAQALSMRLRMLNHLSNTDDIQILVNLCVSATAHCLCGFFMPESCLLSTGVDSPLCYAIAGIV